MANAFANPALSSAIKSARDNFGSSNSVSTYSDVLQKTAVQFAVVLPVALIVGLFTPTATLSAISLVSSLAALVLCFIISMKRSVSVPLIFLYAVVEGAFVGSLTALYGYMFNGVVLTAVFATTITATAIIIGENVGFLKTSPRSRKIFSYLIIGYILFSLAMLAAGFLGYPMRFGSSLSILVSIFGTGMASFSLLSSVEDVKRSTQYGVPEKEAWRLAFGLVVSLVWLYVEILRLVANLSSLSSR